MVSMSIDFELVVSPFWEAFHYMLLMMMIWCMLASVLVSHFGFNG